MAKDEWLYCGGDWDGLVNIIKVEKNCDERLHKFHDILKEDGMTVEDVIDSWFVLEKSDIQECVKDWLYNDDFEDVATLGSLIYWFFNIYTGEALHVKCSVNISYSDIITD